MSIVQPESRSIKDPFLNFNMSESVIELNQETPVADANQRVRYKLLDSWRGLAALSVVTLHGAVPLLGASS